MIKLSLQNTWAHKRRLIGTFLAIVIGIGFLSGTLILGDTLRENFNQLFSAGYAGVDVVVRPEKPVDSGNDDGSIQASRVLDASLVETIEQVPGVRVAVAETQTLGAILGKDGTALGGQGPPTFAASWNPDEGLNPYEIVKGRAPKGPEEIVIDDVSAKDGELSIGSRTSVLLPEKIDVTVVGIARFGSGGSGGITWAYFSPSGTAAHLTKQPGTANAISVAGIDGISQTELRDRIRPVIGGGNEAITGEAIAKEAVDDLNKAFLSFITGFLVAFAGIAVFVGTFSIYNTFSIIVAQRARESALLRAIGATRGQVMSATMIEALVLGVLASVVGFVAGLGFATLLKGVFAGFGLDLPAGGLTLKASAIVVSLVVGVLVTVVAAVLPARRGSRVAPVEALRAAQVEQAVPRRSRTVAGLAVSAAGVGLLAASTQMNSDGTGQITVAGIGAAVLLVGMIVLGPVVARPVARFLGAPLAALGLTGELARENAVRNPRRTSSTAAALLVGVAIVVLFSVFIDSAKNLVTQSVDKTFGGDFVIGGGGFGGITLPPSLADDAAKLPGVASALGLGFQPMKVGKDPVDFYANADPVGLSKLVDLGITDGSAADVDRGSLGVSAERAELDKLSLGDTVPVTWPDGSKQRLRVGMIYENIDIVGDYLIGRADYAAHSDLVVERVVFVKLEEGASAAKVRKELNALVADIGKPDVRDRAEYTDAVAANLNLVLGLVVVMLALAIIVAVMGIANTLSLSAYERTRELGVLRAVGTTRRQLRRLIRWESVIVSTFGTVGGVALGVGLGAVLVNAAFGDSTTSPFRVTPTSVLPPLVLGILVGVLASTLPGYRAARMDVLSAVEAS